MHPELKGGYTVPADGVYANADVTSGISKNDEGLITINYAVVSGIASKRTSLMALPDGTISSVENFFVNNKKSETHYRSLTEAHDIYKMLDGEYQRLEEKDAHLKLKGELQHEETSHLLVSMDDIVSQLPIDNIKSVRRSFAPYDHVTSNTRH